MASPASRSRKNRRPALSGRQWVRIAVVALLLLGGAGVLGWRALQSWRYDRAVRDAQDFLRLGDVRSAVFAAKRAAQVRDDAVEAARLLADALEKNGSVEAVVWRRKVVEMTPGDARERIALAAAALRFRDPKLARSALEQVDAAGRQHIDYLRTAADVAIALGDMAGAEKHLTEILKLDPYDSERSLKLAMVQISSSDAEVAERARRQIEERKDDPQYRLIALRVLLRDATRQNTRPSIRFELSATAPITQAPLQEDPGLLRFAGELLAEEEATVDDCVMAFEVLWRMRGTQVPEKLDRLRTAKVRNAADLGDAMLWLTGRGFPDRTAAWAEMLPEDVRVRPEVQLALADAWIAEKEWGLVQAVVEETEWGEYEAERLAISTIAWRLAGDVARADASWHLAEARLKQDAARLRRLADLCQRWGADPEKEKLWWKLAASAGDQSEVLKRLFTLALQRKDGGALHRAVKGLHEARPEDAPAMNNYAWLSLLRQEDLENAHRLAERVFAVDGKVGAYASTYAYSLHLRGRTVEGLAALESVPSTALKDAAVAGCYGFLLAAAGQQERAQVFLGVARRSPDLLPDEARVFLGTRDRIDRSLEVPELRLFSEQP